MWLPLERCIYQVVHFSFIYSTSIMILYRYMILYNMIYLQFNWNKKRKSFTHYILSQTYFYKEDRYFLLKNLATLAKRMETVGKSVGCRVFCRQKHTAPNSFWPNAQQFLKKCSIKTVGCRAFSTKYPSLYLVWFGLLRGSCQEVYSQTTGYEGLLQPSSPESLHDRKSTVLAWHIVAT